MEVGDTFVNNQGVHWVVTDYVNNKKVTAVSEYGTVRTGEAHNFNRGFVRCLFHPRVYGKGFFGQGPYKSCTTVHDTWGSMLERCYSPRSLEKLPSYAGCVVCEPWLNFQVFAEWFQENYIEGFHLDKDIKEFGNKVYHPDKCLFVPPQVNTFIIDCKAARGACVLGVHVDKSKFKAACRLPSGSLRQKNLGRFDTEQEAFEVYAQFKESLIGTLDTTDEIKVYLQAFLQARHSNIREQKGW